MNAADLYRTAFSRLPKDDLGAYSPRLGRDEPESVDLVNLGADSLELLHQAARCAECDWGPEAAMGTPTDDFSGARRLAMLALLRAEGLFRKGDDQAALDDLVAVKTLGRHLSRGKYLSGLAGFPVEDLVTAKALDVMGRLDPATRRALAERLDSLPPFPALAEAIREEQEYFRRMYRDKFASLEDGDLSRPIRAEFGLGAPTEENAGLYESLFPAGDPAERMLLASGGTRVGLLALADEMLAAFDTLVEIAEDAENAASDRLTALRNAASSNPLLADQLRTFDTMRPIWNRYAQRFAHLRSVADTDGPNNISA